MYELQYIQYPFILLFGLNYSEVSPVSFKAINNLELTYTNMAETGQQKVTAAFPPPPPFWKHFTSQNLKKLEECKKEHEEKLGSKQSWTPEALRMLEVPPELRFLVPPKAPTSGSYSLFGESQSVFTSLQLSWLPVLYILVIGLT